MNKEKDNIFYQARAKILWGKPTNEVEEWLEEQGVTRHEANEILDECLAERAADIKCSGVKKMVKWTLFLLLTASLFISIYHDFIPMPFMNRRGRALCALALFGFYCFTQLIDAIATIIASRKIMGSVIDIREEIQ